MVNIQSASNFMELSEAFLHKYGLVMAEIQKDVLELEDVIQKVLIALLADGHVILEGEPGVGKTLVARTLAKTIDVPCSYVQFTPETMPQDLLYSLGGFGGDGVKMKFDDMRLCKGPIFSRIVIGDEINRAIPRIHGVILSPLQEKIISLEGEIHDLRPLYFWIATQNPVESTETTSQLPEALQERFMLKVHVPYPNDDLLRKIALHDTRPKDIEVVFNMDEIVDVQNAVLEKYVLSRGRDDAIIAYIQGLVTAVHSHPVVRWGPGVRAVQDLTRSAAVHAFLHGRSEISFDDVKEMAHPALRFKFQIDPRRARVYEPKVVSNDDVITEVMGTLSLTGRGH